MEVLSKLVGGFKHRILEEIAVTACAIIIINPISTFTTENGMPTLFKVSCLSAGV